MHDHRFIHGDLKPGNVGIDAAPIRVTLLGIGTASCLERPGDLLLPMPGSAGSVHYLAPECELKQHGSPIDIWAVGVMAYQLTYGYNPFEFRVNPWRVGRVHKKLRPDFIRIYDDAGPTGPAASRTRASRCRRMTSRIATSTSARMS